MQRLQSLFRLSFPLCVLLLVGCGFEAARTEAMKAPSTGGDNTTSKFTAFFKADNMNFVGIYDENSTSAVIGGACTPGALIRLMSSLTIENTTFCATDGLWSFEVSAPMWQGGVVDNPYSNGFAGGSGFGLSATESGVASATVSFNIEYSPTAFPSAVSLQYDATDGGSFYPNIGASWAASLSGRILSIGLSQDKQYKYRYQISRSGVVILTIESYSLTQIYVSPLTPYTYQAGDKFKVTAFDDSGNGPESLVIDIIQ